MMLSFMVYLSKFTQYCNLAKMKFASEISTLKLAKLLAIEFEEERKRR